MLQRHTSFLIWRGKRSSTYLTGEYILHADK